MEHTTDVNIHWFALNVLGNRVLKARDFIDTMGIETYVPLEQRTSCDRNGHRVTREVPAVGRLLFVRATLQQLAEIEVRSPYPLHAYRSLDATPTGRQPIIIPDTQMQIFILVSSSGEKGLEYFSSEKITFKPGTRVRVIQGPLSGSEGHIKRIRGNRRFVVEIHGICAVATSYIPAQFLQKLPD